MSYESGNHEITLLVRYDGVKATQYFSKWTQESDRVFREDLTTLRLPHPKRENTTFLSYGCIQAFWPSVPKSGPFLNQIQRRISPIENQEFKQVCAALYITSCTTKVRDLNPQKRAYPAVAYLPSKKPKISLESDTPLHLTVAKAKEVERSQSISQQLAIPRQLPPPQPTYVPQPLPPNPTHASRFSAPGEIESSRRASHPSLPPHPVTTAHDLASRLPPTPTLSASSQGTGTPAGGLPQPRVVQGSLRTINSVGVQRVPPFPPRPSGPAPAGASAPAPNSQQAGITNMQPAQRLADVNGSVVNSAAPRPADGKVPTAAGAPSTPLPTQTPNNSAFSLQEQLIRLLWTEANKGGGLPAAGRLVLAPPPGRSTFEMAEAMRILEARVLRHKKIVQLVQEVKAIQLEVTAKHERETAALEALRLLDAQQAQALAKGGLRDAAQAAKENEALKIKLEQTTSAYKEHMMYSKSELEKAQKAGQVLAGTAEAAWKDNNMLKGDVEMGVAALKTAQERISQMEHELQEERQKRKDAEDAIQDVRRECRAPFIVPSLLDAFVELSRLTSKATQSGAPMGGNPTLPPRMPITPELRVKQEPT